MNEERPIEKLLRRYAKKRSDEAGPARGLHLATRRMLQSEVERQFPKPASKERSAFDEFVAAFARRWIYAVGVFAVLLVASAMLLPSLSKAKNKTRLAQSEGLRRADAMIALEPAASAPMPASVAVDELAFAVVTNGVSSVIAGSVLADNRNEDSVRRRLGEEKSFSGGGNIKPAADSEANALSVQPIAGSGIGGSAEAVKRETGKALFEHELGGTRNVYFATTPPVELSIVKSKGSVADALAHDKDWMARAGGALEKDAQNYYRQYFVNIQPVAGAKVVTVSGSVKQVTPVLASFQIEQSGNKIRVIDADGSTYHGEVKAEQAYNLTQNGAFKNDGKESLASELRVEQQKQTENLYQFRVEGTNRTLNQQVVFAWNCVPFTNAPAYSNGKIALGEDIKKVDATKFPQQFPGLQNSYINGRAQISSEKEIEINARPSSP